MNNAKLVPSQTKVMPLNKLKIKDVVSLEATVHRDYISTNGTRFKSKDACTQFVIYGDAVISESSYMTSKGFAVPDAFPFKNQASWKISSYYDLGLLMLMRLSSTSNHFAITVGKRKRQEQPELHDH